MWCQHAQFSGHPAEQSIDIARRDRCPRLHDHRGEPAVRVPNVNRRIDPGARHRLVLGTRGRADFPALRQSATKPRNYGLNCFVLG